MSFFSFKGRLPRRRFFWISVKFTALTFIPFIFFVFISIAFFVGDFLMNCESLLSGDKVLLDQCIRQWGSKIDKNLIVKNLPLEDNFFFMAFLYTLVSALFAFPYVKRLHDLNWPASLYFLIFPPIVYDLGRIFMGGELNSTVLNILTVPNLCLLILLFSKKGTKGANKHGPDPLKKPQK